jgi:hypothetical protein
MSLLIEFLHRALVIAHFAQLAGLYLDRIPVE